MPFPMLSSIPWIPALDETIWADGDSLITNWEDEGAATSDLYQSVDSDGDTDFVTLTTPVLNATRTIRFTLEDPSADPAPAQTVELRVKFKYIQVDQPLDNAPTADILIKEGTTTTRASNTGITVTTTATEYSVFMTPTEIGNVTDWTDLYAEISFTTAGNGVDQEANYEVYRVRIIFAP